MPGTNAGTGSPIAFRCARCRRTGARNREYTLTGAWKKVARATSIRMSHAEVEYTCECGYKGRSRHIDIVQRAVSLGVIPSGVIEHRGRLLVKRS